MNIEKKSEFQISKTGILHDLELPLKFQYEDLRLESMVHSQIILKEFCMIKLNLIHILFISALTATIDKSCISTSVTELPNSRFSLITPRVDFNHFFLSLRKDCIKFLKKELSLYVIFVKR